MESRMVYSGPGAHRHGSPGAGLVRKTYLRSESEYSALDYGSANGFLSGSSLHRPVAAGHPSQLFPVSADGKGHLPDGSDMEQGRFALSRMCGCDGGDAVSFGKRGCSAEDGLRAGE